MTDVIVPRRGEELLGQDGMPTLRFIRFSVTIYTKAN